MAQPVPTPERGEIELVGQPMICRARRSLRTARLPGEHTDEILHELGYDERESPSCAAPA